MGPVAADNIDALGSHEGEPRLVRQPIANDVSGIVVCKLEECIGDIVLLEREEDLDGPLLGFGEGADLDRAVELRSRLLRRQLAQLEQLEHELGLRWGEGLRGSGRSPFSLSKY